LLDQPAVKRIPSLPAYVPWAPEDDHFQLTDAFARRPIGERDQPGRDDLRHVACQFEGIPLPAAEEPADPERRRREVNHPMSGHDPDPGLMTMSSK
jgi:hypothetical protein